MSYTISTNTDGNQSNKLRTTGRPSLLQLWKLVRESASDVGGHGFEPWSGPTNNLKKYQRLVKMVLATALLGTQH